MEFKPDNIPVIAITGSSGKTTTRELIAAILETKMEILKTPRNKNLPLHTKKTISLYNPSHKAILLEMGMGKKGAGKRHCTYVQPNFSIITNIGSAHFGNLGNSINETAKFKSLLIKYMSPTGTLFINADDENSKLLDISSFKGTLIKVGINKAADYKAQEIKYLENGMSFKVALDDKKEEFYIPVFGLHNVYNALFAIAISHQLKFTPKEIKSGLEKYVEPIKRLNIIKLKNSSILLDDTVNANPQSVTAAIDVIMKIGTNKKKIVIIGSMLELGEYSKKAHEQIGQYFAEKKIDLVYTYGEEAKWVKKAAIEAGLTPSKVRHFSDRNEMHNLIKETIEPNSIILVKGSSSTEMYRTVDFIKNNFWYSIVLDNLSTKDEIRLNSKTLKQMNIENNNLTMHFGAMTKKLNLRIDESLETGILIIPQKLSKSISIPLLPYEYQIKEDQLYLGPVIGMLVLPRYYKDPDQQLLRFANYNKIKGLIFLFKQSSIDTVNKTIDGYYYNPENNSFILSTLPYPSVIFNRTDLGIKLYNHLKGQIGNNIFNYPYRNTDKLRFWQRMVKMPEIKTHLPITNEYKGVKSLVKMLNVHKGVYLKPTTLAGGNGILLIRKSNNHYKLIDTSNQQYLIKSKVELTKILKNNLAKRKYIMQQEIRYFHEDSKIDFRVYFQKNGQKIWNYRGMETKIANEGSIISNSKNRKKILPGERALAEIYNLDKAKIGEKKKEIAQLCIKVLKKMEQQGFKLGDVAIDLIIDKNLKIWLLEMQVNYAAEIKALRTEDERAILSKILPTPFEYAKDLAGF